MFAFFPSKVKKHKTQTKLKLYDPQHLAVSTNYVFKYQYIYVSL